MRFVTNPELDAYRDDVRAFIAAHAPAPRDHAGVRAPDPEQIPAIRAWIGKLFEAGYLGHAWPVEYGGRPDSRLEHGFIVAEEIARSRSWEQVGAGPLASSALIQFGSQEQKDHFLPRIRSGQDLWCQLFSEPGAGSDLAGLTTRARLDGDHYVVDGQKVWTTNGHHADVGYLLARTDPNAPKHRGITAFAVDIRSPGIEIRPLREITGTSDFNEVFLEGVRIPVDRVIGEVNNGWMVANSSLGHERSGVAARGAEVFAMLDHLLELARGTSTDDGTVLLEDRAVRQQLGRLATDAHVLDLMSKMTQSRMVSGQEDPADAPLLKIAFSEAHLAAAELGLGLQGVEGLAVEGDPSAYANGWWQDAFLVARSYTIAGGANEVLRTVVAERSAGLPREPRP